MYKKTLNLCNQPLINKYTKKKTNLQIQYAAVRSEFNYVVIDFQKNRLLSIVKEINLIYERIKKPDVILF